jgi:hypothetical protein
MFAWALSDAAEAVRSSMVEGFARHGVEVDHWVVPVESEGARVIAS